MEENLIKKRCIVIGGSAGSLQVILFILSSLPADYTIPIIIILHRKNNQDSGLTEVLNARSGPPVKEAEDKETILPGMVYIAPADYHLLVERDLTLSLDASEKVNFSRPSIDVTFQTAAEAYGPGLTGVLLSGANDDGANGFDAIYKAKGVRIVQDPAEAGVPFMPQNAINQNKPNLVLNKEAIADYLLKLHNT